MLKNLRSLLKRDCKVRLVDLTLVVKILHELGEYNNKDKKNLSRSISPYVQKPEIQSAQESLKMIKKTANVLEAQNRIIV